MAEVLAISRLPSRARGHLNMRDCVYMPALAYVGALVVFQVASAAGLG